LCTRARAYDSDAEQSGNYESTSVLGETTAHRGADVQRREQRGVIGDGEWRQGVATLRRGYDALRSFPMSHSRLGALDRVLRELEDGEPAEHAEEEPNTNRPVQPVEARVGDRARSWDRESPLQYFQRLAAETTGGVR
jgi:hypothetical protein